MGWNSLQSAISGFFLLSPDCLLEWLYSALEAKQNGYQDTPYIDLFHLPLLSSYNTAA